MDIVADPVPAAAAPAPAPTLAPAVEAAPVAVQPKRDWLVIVAVLLAGFAATLSAVGLAVASRTVAEARVAIEALKEPHPVAEKPAAHDAAPHTEEHAAPTADHGNAEDPVADAEGDPHDQAVAAAEGDAPEPASPARAGERSEVAALRADIARSQGEAATLANQIRSAQSELASRMSTILLKLDRIDRGRGGE